MPKIEGLERLIAQLRAKAAARVDHADVSVAVGYTQKYAIYVHENLSSYHPVGQAKFLEQPFRTNAEEYATIVVNAMRAGKTLAQALILAGLTLQRHSQQLVPVDTGALKGSAFTRLEVPSRSTGGQQVAEQSG